MICFWWLRLTARDPTTAKHQWKSCWNSEVKRMKTLKNTTFVIIAKPTLAKVLETVTFVVKGFLRVVDSSLKYLLKSSFKCFLLVSFLFVAWKLPWQHPWHNIVPKLTVLSYCTSIRWDWGVEKVIYNAKNRQSLANHRQINSKFSGKHAWCSTVYIIL